MNLLVNELPRAIRGAENMAYFGRPFGEAIRSSVCATGFRSLESVAVGCLRWIWCQWLTGIEASEFQTQVQTIVDRGMEMQSLSARLEWRGRHDLYFLHCAIFASNEAQLKAVAERVVDASGFGGTKLEERDGEFYASAYCGMLKYWILGDMKKAAEQSDVIWKAHQDDSFRAAAKTLVAPWLKQDWQSFSKSQHKDFERLWGRIRKDRTVMTESGDDIVINNLLDFSVPQFWCWAHCGLAVLAHRRYQLEVATDPLLFPPHALKVVPKP